MVSRRTLTNLAAVALASTVLLLYGLTQLLAGTLFDSTYPLHMELDTSDGLVEDKEVSYNGVGIGKVTGLELVGDRVRVDMAIDDEVEVPADVDVVVMRSSPVGEQRLDLRPVGDGGGETLEPGDRVTPREVTMPTRVQPLLELAADVLEPVDPEQAGQVVGELADTVRGRREDIRGFMDDSARFSSAVADRGEDYDRFFAASRQVNAALADNRDTLGRLFGEITEATAILTDMRADYERLLSSGPPVLSQAGDIIQRGQANLSCSLDDFSGLTAYMAEDEQLANASEALRVNQWFFEGFNRITPQDARGNWWQRIHFAAEPIPPTRSYMPDKRPIPATLPGGACSSPFGEGAGAAAQHDFALTVPEGRLVPPENGRTEPVRRDSWFADASADGGNGDAPGEPASGDDRVADAASADSDDGDDGDDGASAESDGSGLADSGVTLAALVVGALGVIAAGWGALRATVRSREEDHQ